MLSEITTPALTLITERLKLIPINRDHAMDLFKVLNDPSLYTFTGDSPPMTVAALADRYERWETRRSPDGSDLWLNWALRLHVAGELIGHLQASVRANQADMAWTVGRQWQRRGYATEAAKTVKNWLFNNGIHEIRASINPDHKTSIRLAERLGLRRTTQPSGSELIWKLASDGESTRL